MVCFLTSIIPSTATPTEHVCDSHCGIAPGMDAPPTTEIKSNIFVKKDHKPGMIQYAMMNGVMIC
jgi:hypothetical protein